VLDQSTVYGVGLVYISDIDYAQRRHIDKDFQPMSPISMLIRKLGTNNATAAVSAVYFSSISESSQSLPD